MKIGPRATTEAWRTLRKSKQKRRSLMSTWVRIRDEVRTREQITDVAARAASGFASLGTGPGDVVTVYMRNDFALMEASIGAGMTGAYVTPANWHSPPEEARYVFENSGAKAIVI